MTEINCKHILHLSREEKLKFINSFDFILTDCDGEYDQGLKFQEVIYHPCVVFLLNL